MGALMCGCASVCVRVRSVAFKVSYVDDDGNVATASVEDAAPAAQPQPQVADGGAGTAAVTIHGVRAASGAAIALPPGMA